MKRIMWYLFVFLFVVSAVEASNLTIPFYVYPSNNWQQVPSEPVAISGIQLNERIIYNGSYFGVPLSIFYFNKHDPNEKIYMCRKKLFMHTDAFMQVVCRYNGQCTVASSGLGCNNCAIGQPGNSPSTQFYYSSETIYNCDDSVYHADDSVPPVTTLGFPLSGSLDTRSVLLEFGEDWLTDCGGLVKKHTGIDIEAVEGELVYAAESGFVKSASVSEEWGGWVTIEHAIAKTTVYWHIAPLVSINQSVSKGEPVGIIVNYGGPVHLHFGLRNGAYSNTSNRGALPQLSCDNDPAFPENFVDPRTITFE